MPTTQLKLVRDEPESAEKDAAVDGHGLPFLQGGTMPPTEPPRRTRRIRTVAIAALSVSTVYLLWRAFFTIDLAVWFMAIPMFALEVHQAFGLGIYTFSLWDVNQPEPPPPVLFTDRSIALLIPTYDESAEVLLPVISAAVALEPAHETWVLDDGNRPFVAEIAAELGAKYLARTENTDAKAGNINNALKHIDAEIIAVLDADHVALAGFLTNTLGYFDDPDVAVVQTPQAFYNVGSFEHEARKGGKYFNEQTVFYRVILPAKSRWDAVFWCGTGALLRVEALRSVGGVANGSVTEDIHTSIRMHKAGWRLLAHNEVLARGLAATDAQQYMLQRERWARGAMQVIKQERPFTSPELTFRQRLAYGSTLFGWFDSLRSLFFVLLPVAVLITGVIPIRAPMAVFGPMFLATLSVQFAALRLLARGHFPPVLSLTFEMVRMPAVVPALMELVLPRRSGFKVTPKGRTGERRSHQPLPGLLSGLILVSVVAVAFAALSLAGLTPLHYSTPGAVYGTILFLLVNAGFLATAARRVRDARFAGERRASVRFPVSIPGTFEGLPVRITDLSLTGARVRIPGTLEGFRAPPAVSLGITPAATAVRATVASVREASDSLELGLQFVAGQAQAARDIALMLFHGRGLVSATPATSEGDLLVPALAS